MEMIKDLTAGRPDVFQFTDYREFLKGFYEWKKTDGEFSHRIFAARAGLKSSSFLRLVLTGKRNLSPDGISKFVVGLGLSRIEGQAFEALVHFNQARDFESRKRHWESFLKARPDTFARPRVNDEYKYLARMAYPILLVILRQPHVSKSLENLSKMTGLKIREVEEALVTLRDLGAIQQVGHDEYIVTSEGFRTSNDTPSIARQTFHRNMLEKAKECLELSPLLREFQAMMVPLNHEELSYVKSRIRALVDEVDQKFGGKRSRSEKVYALNINLIPVTPDFIRGTGSVTLPPAAQSQASQKSDINGTADTQEKSS